MQHLAKADGVTTMVVLQALVELGEEANVVGAKIVPLAAGADRDSGFWGLSPHFSPQQLQVGVSHCIFGLASVLEAPACLHPVGTTYL